MDNCFRENKNKYVLAYMSYLIKCNLFARIEMSFMLVGHTHNDVDQLFYLIGKALKHNAFTIESLHETVINGCQHLIHTEHVTSFPNFSELCRTKGYCNNIKGKYFKL